MAIVSVTLASCSDQRAQHSEAHGVNSGAQSALNSAQSAPRSAPVMSCDDRSRCRIAGLDHTLAGTDDTTRFSWDPKRGPSQALVVAQGYMSCGSATHCVLLAKRASSGRAQPMWTANAGHTWTWADAGGVAPARVSCVTVAVCFAFGTAGKQQAFIASSDGGRHWTLRAPPPMPQDGEFDGAISCADVSSCLVAGHTRDYLVIVATRDGGRTWTTAANRSHPVWRKGSGWVSGALSCPSALRCLVLLTKGHESQGLLWRTTDGGNYWRETQLKNLQGSSLSCASTDDCVLTRDRLGVDGAATGTEVLSTSDFGAKWVAIGSIDGYLVRYFDCPSVSECVALSSPAHGTGPDVAFTTADGGARWQCGASGTGSSDG